MDQPDSELQRHYRTQQLAPDRANSILAAGHAAAKRRERRRYWQFAAAAALVVSIGGWFVGSNVLRSSGDVPVGELATAVVNYFSKPNPTLPVVSEDRVRLRAWLGSKRAPTSFEIPPALARLKSVGCEVLDVRGHQVGLLCFFLDTARLNPAAASATIGTASSIPGAAADVAPRLVHLLVVSRHLMIDTPKPGQIVQLDAKGQWKAIAWTKGELVYVAATDVTGLQLGGFAHVL